MVFRPPNAGGYLQSDASKTPGAGNGVGQPRRLDKEGIFEVVHDVVVLRSAPSVSSSPVGRLTRDAKVRGTPHAVAQEPWLLLSEQVLPPPSRVRVNAGDQVWVLIDASSTALGLGQLLRRVDGGSASHSGARGQPEVEAYRVVHTRVIVRQSASTEAEILGFEAKGALVEGAVTKVAGREWLKTSHHDRSGKPCDGFMLIDGTPLGLGVLLEKAHPSASSTAKPKKQDPTSVPSSKQERPSAAKPEIDTRELVKWLSFPNGELGSFTVVHSRVMLRSLPSTKSTVKGTLKQGDKLEGEIRHDWLLLDPGLDQMSLTQGKGRWALIDGSSAGLGRLLERVIPAPKVQQEFGNALELCCPDVRDKSKYSIEVKPESGKELSLQCGSGKFMLVHGLESACRVQLRFHLTDGDSVISSAWQEAYTKDVLEWEDGDEFSTDLMGNQRGACSQCSCLAFALEEDGVSMNMDVGAARCARCGCKADAHPLVQRREAPKAQAAPKPTPKEPLWIEKAVALPKEKIMKRWARFDVPEHQAEWPHLPSSFKEAVAWSDLHADMGKNMEHLRHLPVCKDTVLLLAGDVATNLEIIESSLRVLLQKFGAIFYVPGNHELWVHKKDGLSSVHKFFAILDLCERLGVHTRPAFISDECAVCPLFSWYKDNLVDGFRRDLANIPFDVQTQWPWGITGSGDTNDAQQPEIADFFAELNLRRLKSVPAPPAEGERGPFVVTLSHFVPRQECYPGPRRLCGVMGCREIDDQVRACRANCHIFGHSHISCDRQVDQIRYVQHPLGYPNDYHRMDRPLRVWGSTGRCELHPEDIATPSATTSIAVAKEFLDEIRDARVTLLQRPPGRWSSVDEGAMWDKAHTFDRAAERALRNELGFDAKKMAELWSAPPKAKDLDIKITHLHDGTELVLQVTNDLLVKQLKDRIATKVGRGPASKIKLSTNGENALSDDVSLSSLEQEIAGGLLLMGISLAASTTVDIKIVHALAEPSKSMRIKISDTSTIHELRKAIMEQLQESRLSECKLVKRMGQGGFASIPDTEKLNGRTEFLFIGRDFS
eukprot:TRINITY_DN41192_c0_g1_i1.p1 TRINITY_DN41192_c0_g1~~TRINITY_DN41192_c0_g1_i1.p1  ORF type:complete len:1056 (-),score=159.03 TRINITY_DN41192_c0_g1_i1:74-3241(-)